jgi:RNA polymerase sigma factor (TIGR02999 family)
MRRILVENARRKQSAKHGGNRRRVKFDEAEVPIEGFSDDIIALDGALAKLADQKPLIAEVVRLRYFAGLTLSQISEILGIARRTLDGYWAYARGWLYREVSCPDEEES